ncbi:multidrug efflux MFS transporter [Lampropedia puyangensis]|uniref:Multidrug efflux MFS transporter n=1 Tax=Lampropedia puyangensis TaxID=1330072 RepID=A0A4S8EVK5_9BURK|nr:DHA2 family efflux MFS transporter permease subunit [Lampropedia puyangensis]THT98792.1 multidrug efflux MFS transporter [Lampropedia puyangensis]
MTETTAPPTLAPGSLQALTARYGEHFRWYFLLSLMVGTIASLMSATVVNVAIPALSHHFALGQERAQWVSSAFMAANTVAMLTTPWLLFRYGYRRTYIAMLALLAIGGIVGGLAHNFSLVLTARLLEGIAAGVLQPIPAIIILYAFLPHQQGKASGLFGMGVVLAPALGPTIGGILVDWWGWRSIFYMVVPFCAAGAWLALRFVPTTAPGGVPARKGEALEWRSLLMVTVGTLSLLNGLVWMHDGRLLPAVGLLSLALGCCLLFTWWQQRLVAHQHDPLMDFRVFGSKTFCMGCIVAFIYGAALFGSTYLLPVFMQVGLEFSASEVGLIMLPSGLVLAITIAIAGRMADSFSPRLLVGLGLWMLAGSFGLMYFMRLGSSIGLLIAISAFGRIGLGFILPSLNLVAVRPLKKELISQGSSIISFIRMLGGVIGVSLCGIVLEWRVAAQGDSLTNPHSSPERIAAFGETFVLLGVVCALAYLAARHLRAVPTTAPQPTADATSSDATTPSTPQ